MSKLSAFEEELTSAMEAVGRKHGILVECDMCFYENDEAIYYRIGTTVVVKSKGNGYVETGATASGLKKMRLDIHEFDALLNE